MPSLTMPEHSQSLRVRAEGIKKEKNRLCQLKVLKKANHSEWTAPAFIIPKKDGSV